MAGYGNRELDIKCGYGYQILNIRCLIGAHTFGACFSTFIINFAPCLN
jgi:hypothetical protein